MKSKIYLYELPVSSFIDKREGILLHLQNETGKSAWGEIAPLPSYNQETLQDALKQLIENKDQLSGNISTFYPSVSFGIESALLDLSSHEQSKSLPISALLMGTYEEILQKAELCSSQGYKSAKLKVSSLPLSRAIDLAKRLKDIFCLRIDANRAWSLKEGLNFISHFEPQDFDYFEEPLKDPSELKDFPFPFALDESLREPSCERLFSLPHLKAFVVKPTFLGGISFIQKLQTQAKNRGIEIVLSSAFESGVGIHQIAKLADYLGITSPLGIDTYRFLKHDLLESPLKLSQGRLELRPLVVNKALLKEVDLG